MFPATPNHAPVSLVNRFSFIIPSTAEQNLVQKLTPSRKHDERHSTAYALVNSFSPATNI